MFYFIRLLSACVIFSFIISLLPTSFANSLPPPKIDENGRLILPNPIQLSKLPTNSEQFFKNNNAYEYGARLYIQEVGEVDKTHGYTIYSQRAYNEIESVLGHTPKWESWADKIKAHAESDGSIQIAGHLTTNGVQKKGDYSGSAAFRTISKNSRDSTKNHAFSEILPEIRARNYFIDQLDHLNLSPQDRAWLHQAYLDRREQAQPNEYRAPYGYDFENQDKPQRKSRNDRYSERQGSANFGVFALSGGGDITIGVGKGLSSSVYVSTDDGFALGTSSTYSDTAGFGADVGVGFDWYRDMNSYAGRGESLEICAIVLCGRLHRNPDTKDLTGGGFSPSIEFGGGSATLHESETILHQNH